MSKDKMEGEINILIGVTSAEMEPLYWTVVMSLKKTSSFISWYKIQLSPMTCFVSVGDLFSLDHTR